MKFIITGIESLIEKPKRGGYTGNLFEAGIYTEEQANSNIRYADAAGVPRWKKTINLSDYNTVGTIGFEINKAISEYQNEITALKAQLASAIDVLKDFELREDHLPNCEAVAWMGGECKCMDQEYYSLRECSKRARLWLNSLKGDK